MQKSEKTQLVAELSEKFAKTTSAVLATFSKLDVETATKLRKKLRDGGVEYRVLKNTLARRAAKGTTVEAISDDFVGPVALAMSYGDVVAPAKILSEFVKDLATIKIVGGVVEGKKVDPKGVEALAKMPGLPELRAQILGMLNQPAGKLVRTIAEPGAALARVIQAKAEPKT